MQEYLQKYNYINTSLNKKKATMKAKLPDIKTALDIVTHLRSQCEAKEGAPPINIKFALGFNIWAGATIQNSGKVCLWLGADTMVEYSYDEAIALLKKNLDNAEKYLETVDSDLNFLRDQITTTEVNMARVHNEHIRQEGMKTGKGLSEPGMGKI